MNILTQYPGRNGYRSEKKAERYSGRSPKRNEAESALLFGTLAEIVPPSAQAPSFRVLDVPSGEGRLSRRLRIFGYESFESDISKEMLEKALKNGSPTGLGVVGDIEGRLPFQNGSFDLVLCWRLLQHLPTKQALYEVMGELSRVTRKWVVLSFFHPLSLHNLQRRVAAFLTGRKGCRYTHSKKEIRLAGNEKGLELVKFDGQSPYLRDLWIAVFAKKVK